MATPGGPLGAAQPIADSVLQIPGLKAILKMLGIGQPQPQVAPAIPPQGPTMVDEANESFRKRAMEEAAQPNQPVVAPPRRKPMGGMK